MEYETTGPDQDGRTYKVQVEYFKHCGDCGVFVSKDRWIRKDNSKGHTHALCRECESGYDGPEYH